MDKVHGNCALMSSKSTKLLSTLRNVPSFILPYGMITSAKRFVCSKVKRCQDNDKKYIPDPQRHRTQVSRISHIVLSLPLCRVPVQSNLFSLCALAVNILELCVCTIVHLRSKRMSASVSTKILTSISLRNLGSWKVKIPSMRITCAGFRVIHSGFLFFRISCSEWILSHLLPSVGLKVVLWKLRRASGLELT